MADQKTETKAELQTKYDRLLGRFRGARKEMNEKEGELLDGLLTLGGGAAGGLVCKHFGPYGEGTAGVPVNLLVGAILAGVGLSGSADEYSGEVAAVGLGMLAFQTGLVAYGDGYVPDDKVAGEPDEVGYGYDDFVGAARPARPARRVRQAQNRQQLPPGQVLTYDRMQELLRRGQPIAA